MEPVQKIDLVSALLLDLTANLKSKIIPNLEQGLEVLECNLASILELECQILA